MAQLHGLRSVLRLESPFIFASGALIGTLRHRKKRRSAERGATVGLSGAARDESECRPVSILCHTEARAEHR